MASSLQIGDVTIPGRVLTAPMTGVSDLPFRRAAAACGAPYVATEMVACDSFARGRPAGGDAGKGAQREPGKGPPPEALDACRGKSNGAACYFTGRQNEALSGSCFTPPDASGQPACRPDRGGPGKR